MAAISLVISAPLLIFFLREPPTRSKDATAQPHDHVIKSEVPGVDLRTAVRSYPFCTIGLGMFGVAAGTGGMAPILIPLLGDSGYSATEAAAYAGWIGVMLVLGRVMVGLLMDYLWAPLVAFIFFAPAAIACFLLTTNGIGPVAVVISVLLIGLVAGAEYDVVAFLVSRYFGMKFFGSIYSWVYVIFISAIAVAPLVYGAAYDVFCSYDIQLIGTGILVICGSTALLTLGPIPKEYARASVESESGER